MKQIMIVVLAIFASIQMQAQSGRVKITFLGFKCYRETWDDILGMDGRGDEVFFQFTLSSSDKNGNPRINKFERRTDVYGQKAGAFSNRVKAGSESPEGGIRAGDLVNANVLLGEFDMGDGDFVTVIPTAWEQDPVADNSNAFASTVGSFVASLNQRIAPVMIGLHLAGGDLAGALIQGASLGISATRPAGDQGELGHAGTRPIGMKKSGDFTPFVAALNTPNLISFCKSNYGWGNGVMEVRYNEPALGNARDHGDYAILLKFEFTPTSNPAPAPAPRPTNNAAPAPAPQNNTNAAPAPAPSFTINNDLVVGSWRGTMQTNGEAGTAPLNLRLNDRTFWLLKNDGSNMAIAAGLFTVKNNVMVASYTTNDNVTYTYTSTSFNKTTSEMSGTWTTGTKSGTWTVKRWAM
ncbi:MAG: hypothetical protein QM726_25365 [Chitinophagaceae bacterium]